jgi:hypothetical protein
MFPPSENTCSSLLIISSPHTTSIGTISLVDDGTPVISIITDNEIREKTISNVYIGIGYMRM